jgi:1-acyl-sn-glycerol-3-phosphate acyltransferase
MIYPEGTRRPPGAEPKYKMGVVNLYERLNVPVVPIAHVPGSTGRGVPSCAIRARSRSRCSIRSCRASTANTFHKTLVERIETACDRQLLELADDPERAAFPGDGEEACRRVEADAVSRTGAA